MSDQASGSPDKEVLVFLRTKAISALSRIDDIRAGKNVTKPDIWRACEKLDELIERINQELK